MLYMLNVFEIMNVSLYYSLVLLFRVMLRVYAEAEGGESWMAVMAIGPAGGFRGGCEAGSYTLVFSFVVCHTLSPPEHSNC